MCDCPSWIIDENGKAHWLLDNDIKRAIDGGTIDKQTGNVFDWHAGVGHHAIEQLLGVKGKHLEGRVGLPDAFASDIRSGRYTRLARAGSDTAKLYIPDLLPPGLQEELKIYGVGPNGEGADAIPAKCTRNICIAHSATSVSLPKLTSSGYIDARSATSVSLPKLEQCSGYIDARSATSVSLPKLEQCSGYICADSATSVSLPKLEQCSGYICADSATSVSLPKLTSSGYINARSATSVSLPKLTSSGTICADSATSVSLPKLTSSGTICADSATSVDVTEFMMGKVVRNK